MYFVMGWILNETTNRNQQGQDQSKIQQQQERLKAAEEQRDSILAQILTSEARERREVISHSF